MNKIKTGLLAVGGTAVGIITLRRLRKRRSATAEAESSEHVEDAKAEVEETTEDVEQATEDVVEAKDEAITAVKHAGGAAKHAGLAGVKAVRSRKEKAEAVDVEIETTDSN